MTMTKGVLSGDEALALGALAAGVRLVASYPGSPSSGAIEAIIPLAEKLGIYVEWSSNERVALEMAIGASIAGRRALVGTKSVGLNAMIDPLMALNLTPVRGGLVILLGDDPGAYGSQNDQDSRPGAAWIETPLVEPSDPAEGYAMMRDAFSISEKFGTAVIVRETRAFSQQTGAVALEGAFPEAVRLGFNREPWRFVAVPLNAVEKHRELHKRIEALSIWADEAPYNSVKGAGTKGVISAGFAHRKLLDIIGSKDPAGFRLLKLGVLFPLPRKSVSEFLRSCDEILVVEENEPYLETQIKATAYDSGATARIYGKESGHLDREGELFRWQIQRGLSRFIPGFAPSRDFRKDKEKDEIPKRESHCAGCRYDEIVDALENAAESSGLKLILIADPGCLVTVADSMDAKFALGSAVGVADGMSKSGAADRPVAIFGDSAFFHSSLPAICNAVHNQSDILIVVLDNRATATSGFQPHPGVGRNALGNEAPALDIDRIAQACGIGRILKTGLDDPDAPLGQVFREALSRRELTLVIVRC
jgi:indolepyruvate ferredoxin oxidoreductase, alpha subunit